MHIFFAAARRPEGAGGESRAPDPAADAGQMVVVRDPDDESEWQYLGNPEIAATTSLKDVVARFIKDCGGADGLIDPGNRTVAQGVRDALLMAAKQIDDVLGSTART